MKLELKKQILATIQQTGLVAENFTYSSREEGSEDICIEYLENNNPTGLKFDIKSLPDSSYKFKCRHTLYCPSMKYSNWYPVPLDENDSIGDVCKQLSCWIEYTLKDYISDQVEVDLWDKQKAF